MNETAKLFQFLLAVGVEQVEGAVLKIVSKLLQGNDSSPKSKLKTYQAIEAIQSLNLPTPDMQKA